jgi:hypothetical protein
MSDEKVSNWSLLERPPKTALKTIKGGRLSGMTDINPQWRYKAMHDVFGPCGEGWKYEVERIWTEPGTEGKVFLFAQVKIWVKTGVSWSDPIPGVGGSMLIDLQGGKLHHNDEGPKMAITDALSVAMKMLGVGSDIYMGRYDGSKYKDEENQSESFAKKASEKSVTPTAGALENFSEDEQKFIKEFAEGIQVHFDSGIDHKELVNMLEERHLATEEKVAVWSLLDSKCRSAIKKAKAVNTPEEIASQA